MKKRIVATIITVGALILIVALIFGVAEWTWGACRREASLHDADSKYVFSYTNTLDDLDISSPQGFVYSVSDDTIIFTKGEHKVVHPGSVTKLLTAIYALTILHPSEIIIPTDELELVKPDSSIAYIKSHHKISVEMLIEGMMLPSGNDAAYVIAAAGGRRLINDLSISGKRAVEIFMDGMNKFAEEIGLCGTHFVSPDGYSDEEHYTTTEDLLIISRLAMDNEIIMKYSSMESDDVVYASGHTNNWSNTNKLIDKESEYYNENVIGLKTGSIDREYSIIFVISFDDGREYIAGVFGSPNKDTRYEDALKIIDEIK